MSEINRYRRSGKKTLVFFHNFFIKILFFFLLRSIYVRLFNRSFVGKKVAIHNNVYFFDFTDFAIGNNSTLNSGCYIDNRNGVFIGKNVNISHDCKIYSMGHDVLSENADLNGGPVFISDDVWIFPNCLIMPGVKIGKGAVVYPGSVVTRDVLDFTIVGGNPARPIRKRTVNIEYTLDNRIWFAK